MEWILRYMDKASSNITVFKTFYQQNKYGDLSPQIFSRFISESHYSKSFKKSEHGKMWEQTSLI